MIVTPISFLHPYPIKDNPFQIRLSPFVTLKSSHVCKADAQSFTTKKAHTGEVLIVKLESIK